MEREQRIKRQNTEKTDRTVFPPEAEKPLGKVPEQQKSEEWKKWERIGAREEERIRKLKERRKGKSKFSSQAVYEYKRGHPAQVDTEHTTYGPDEQFKRMMDTIIGTIGAQ